LLLSARVFEVSVSETGLFGLFLIARSSVSPSFFNRGYLSWGTANANAVLIAIVVIAIDGALAEWALGQLRMVNGEWSGEINAPFR